MEEFLQTDQYIIESMRAVTNAEISLKRIPTTTPGVSEAIARCNMAWVALCAIRAPIRCHITKMRILQEEEEKGIE